MTTNLHDMFGLEKPTHFPPMPDGANLMACLFLRFGGSFHIEGNGDRRIMVPEPCMFRLNDQDMPSLPNAKPHEQFHRSDEFRGAMKLITGVLARLHPEDRDFIYDAYAHALTAQQAEEASTLLRTSGTTTGGESV